MPALVLGDVLLVTFKGTAFGQTILNTFNYQCTTVSGGPPDIFTIYTGIAAQLGGAGIGMTTAYLNIMPPEYTFDEIWVQRIYNGRVRKGVFSVAGPGLNSQHASTANMAGVLERRGDLGNRSNVGGIHLLYPNLDSGSSGGSVSSAWVGLANTFAAKVVTTLNVPSGGTFVPILFKRTAPTAFTQVTTISAKTSLRVMRRRTLGLGI